MRLFRFDPFATRPREKCTASALRAESADVDTSIRPRRDTGARKKILAADLGRFAEKND
jgi:hypothetical protein